MDVSLTPSSHLLYVSSHSKILSHHMLHSALLQADLPFSIGSSTGIIRLTSVLDFDTQASYTLRIQAEVSSQGPQLGFL